MTDKNEFAGMPEIPAHVYEQIDKGFHKYLFFETVKRGQRRYTCTACHKSFDESELVLKDLMSAEDFALFHAKHNDEAECPLCGARATVKNVKVCDVTRFWASNCVAVFMANGHDDVWIRCIYADRGYRYNPKEQMISLTGKTLTFESNRYHLTPGSAVHWKAWGRDYPLRLANIPEEPFSWNHSMFMEKYHYSIVWATEGGIEDTFLRYNGMDSGNCRYGYNYPVRYLCHYARHPQLEMLLKLGHEGTVWNVVMENSDNKRIMNWDAKTPWELFGLTRKEYNRWGAGPRYHRFDINILKIYKRMKGKGERDFEYAEELEKVFYNLQGAYGFIAKAKCMGVEIRELMRYIRRVQKNSGGACWHCIGITLKGAYTLWCDYINLAEGAGQGKSVSVMPKDLKAAHDLLSAAVDVGRLLCEAKEKVPYGEWGEWLEKNVSYSVSNANNMMRLYQEQQSMAQLDMFGNNDFSVFEGMTPSQVLALLPVPRAERANFIEETGAKDMSVREINAAVKARKEAEKRAEEAEARAADAEKREKAALERGEDLSARLESAETQIKLMESMPATVPDEEIKRIQKEAAEKAKAEAEKKIEAAKKKAEKELEKARAEGAEAVKKVEAAKEAEIKAAEEQARAAAEQEAAAKIAEMERELAAARVSASPYLLRFQERMTAFQSAYAAMVAVVDEAERDEPETGAQLRAALAQIASALVGG